MNNESRIVCSINLNRSGKTHGDLLLRHSDNDQPLGHYPIPIFLLANGDGPTALLIGGVHGDEFNGPVALMRLFHRLSADDVQGRIIFLPTLNKPAIDASSRISPLDQVNMNRAFPGDPNGGPTHMLAHYIEHILMPQCDIVIDLHTGGKASIFKSCVLASRAQDTKLTEKNLNLAKAFGLSPVWLLGDYNDDRSVNAAAIRNQIAMIATELGGGDGSDPIQVGIAEKGLRQCLSFVGILNDEIFYAQNLHIVETGSHQQNLNAPVTGLFDRSFSAGDKVAKNQFAGNIYPSDQPAAAPVELRFSNPGLVLAHGNRGHVKRGEMLAIIANEVIDLK